MIKKIANEPLSKMKAADNMHLLAILILLMKSNKYFKQNGIDYKDTGIMSIPIRFRTKSQGYLLIR